MARLARMRIMACRATLRCVGQDKPSSKLKARLSVGEFRISHVRITFGRVGWRDKKGGCQGSWMEHRFFFWRWGWAIHTSQLTPLGEAGAGGTISHSNAPHQPISPHIDEDALEGLYFAFSPIHVLLPYFSPYRRPRGSYELLEAFLPSLTENGATSASPSPPTRASGSLES